MNQMVRSDVLDGEILGEDDTVRVLVTESPFKPSPRAMMVPAGFSLGDIVELVGDPRFECVVSIEGMVVSSALWPRVRPKAGTTVVLRAVLGDPFSAIAGLISAITAATASFSAFIGSLGIFGQILSTAIGIGFNLLIGALFPAAKPKQVERGPDGVQGYSVAASRNQSSLFEAVPVVLGEHRVTPPYGARPYTQSDGPDQLLYVIFVWGYGPLNVTQMKIGETDLASFQDVQIEHFGGYETDPPPSLYPSQVLEESLQIELKVEDGYSVRTTSDNITEFSVDFVWQRGLYRQNNDGIRDAVPSNLSVRYRRVGTSDWTTLILGYAGATPDTLRATERVAVATGQYEVGVRKDSDIPEDPKKYVVIDEVYWIALRGTRPGRPITFPKPLCMTVLRIRASSQLNGQLDTFNGIAQSLVTSLNTGNLEASRNPPDLFFHVLRGAANARAVSVEQIDIPSLTRWWYYCNDNGWTYDAVLTDRASVYDRLVEIAAAGRAVPIFRDGLWSAVWDEPNAPVVQVFTPRNSWGFEASHEFRELPHAWRTRFVNRDKGYIDDERIVYDDGYDASNATLFEGLQFPGVTSADAVWRHGRFHLAQLRLRPEVYMISVDWENLVVTRGDRVRLAYDVMLLGICAARVTAVDAASRTITLDEFVQMEPDKLYVYRSRDKQGGLTLYSVEAATGEARTLRLAGSAPLPGVGDLGTFGEGEKDSGVFRVLSIERQDELTATLTLVDDAPGIALADKGAIPAFQSNVTAPVDPATIPPYRLEVVETTEVDSGTVTYVATLLWRIIAGSTPDAFVVEATRDGDLKRVTVTERSARFENLSPGVWTFRVRAVLPNNRVTALSEARSVQILSETRVPPNPEGFAISPIGDVATLSWTVPLEPIRSSEIRYSPATAGATWASAVVIVDRALGGSTQVSFQSGTYLVKHVSYGGVYSDQPALLVVSNAGVQSRNVVLEVEEMQPFDGQHDSTQGGPYGLELQSAFDAFAVPNLFGYRDAFLGDVGFFASGIYTLPDVTDLGEVFTSRLTASLMAEGINVVDDIFAYEDAFALPNAFSVEPQDWTVDVEVSTTSDDPSGTPVWSSWTRLIVGDYVARAFRFRLVLRQTRYGITPRVSYLNILIDMPDRIEAGRGVVVPVAGLRVPFVPAFRAVDGLSRSDRNLATGDQAIVSNLGPTGFDILYRNASGAAVERTLDWLAKGYGRKVS